MFKPKNIIIAGGNAAGPSAAAKAKRVNPEANVLLFEEGEFISTGTCEIPYVFSGDINSYRDIVYYSSESFYEEKSVEVYIKHSLEEIDRHRKSVLVRNLSNNKQIRFNYDSLILTTGSTAQKITAFSGGFENVFYIKSIRDLIKLNEYVDANNVKSAAIIGSGYIGLEMAEAFHARNIETTIIEKETLAFPESEIEIQYLVKDIITEKGISFYGNISGIKQTNSNNKIKSLIIENRRLEIDLVLVAIGVQPNNTLAIKSRLETGKFGGLKVDKKLKTSDPFIFAAGDNIEPVNFITGKPDFMPFAALAHEFGHIAGENAAGGNVFADPVIKNSALKIFDYSFATVGLNTKEASLNRLDFSSVYSIVPDIVKVMPGSKNVFGKLLYEKSTYRILGASFLGGREVTGYADLISSLMLSKADARLLARINYNYTPPLSPFVNLLSVLGRKVK